MMTEKDNNLCSNSEIRIIKGEKLVKTVFILCAINSS